MLRRFGLLCFLLTSEAAGLRAADPADPENFRIEITGSTWLIDTTGSVQSKGTQVDFVSDLGFEQQKPMFYGKLVLKPGRKHRILIEGSPFRFDGNNTIHRSITYQGQTFNIDEMLKTTASLDYLFAGYQYDLLSGPAGHLGLSVGGAYLNATATIVSLQPATSAARTQDIGLPLAGAEFRIFPLHKWFDIDGGVRGMTFGDYGHYVEGGANASLWLGPLALQGGYRIVNTTLQQTGGNPGGITVRMKGPIFSLAFKW